MRYKDHHSSRLPHTRGSVKAGPKKAGAFTNTRSNRKLLTQSTLEEMPRPIECVKECFDFSSIENHLLRLIESSVAEKEWHRAHHQNIALLGTALNKIIDCVDPQLPRIDIIAPFFETPSKLKQNSLPDRERRRPDADHQVTHEHFYSKSVHKNSQEAKPCLHQIALEACRNGTWRSNEELHTEIRAVTSVAQFRKLDYKSYSAIFPLLCDWFFRVDGLDIGHEGLHERKLNQINDEPLRKRHHRAGDFRDAYCGFLLLYEGVRHFPNVFFQPYNRDLLQRVLSTLQKVYASPSLAREVGLMQSDVSGLNNHLIRILDARP